MDNILLAANWLHNNLWYTLPLIIAVSLVYSATRHEKVRPLLRHALRIGLWITGFMLVLFLILALFWPL
jgi:hypothetical protein